MFIMISEVIFNPDLHIEHESWNREIHFWEDELISFQNRLDELVRRWTDKSVLSQIDKFQNQVYIHRDVLNKIKNQIEMHEVNMADHYRKNEDVLNKNLVKKHIAIRDQMESQRKVINRFKKNLFLFLTKYM